MNEDDWREIAISRRVTIHQIEQALKECLGDSSFAMRVEKILVDNGYINKDEKVT